MISTIKLDGISCDLQDEESVQFHKGSFSSVEMLEKAYENGATAAVMRPDRCIYIFAPLRECINALTTAHQTDTYLIPGLHEREELGYVTESERLDIYCTGINEADHYSVDSRRIATKPKILELVRNIENGSHKSMRPNGNPNVELRWGKRFLELANDEDNDFHFLWDPSDYAWGLDLPTLVKSRSIENPKKSAIVPLHRYFPWDWRPILRSDPGFDEKKPMAVWRGTNSSPFYVKRKEILEAENTRKKASRRDLVERHFGNSFHDIALSEAVYVPPEESIADDVQRFIRNRMTIEEQLGFKYILCAEGNDYPSNLPWVLLSNSVPVMPPPFVETWLVERRLQAWKHYVPLDYDFSDLDEKINWCNCHVDLCRDIAYRSKAFALQFFDQELESRLAKSVIRRYRKNVRLVVKMSGRGSQSV